mgnify:CR=1 FL=1
MKSKFESVSVIPVLIFENADHAASTAGALIDGGLDVLEVTLRTEASWDAFDQIMTQYPNAVTGVGTVLGRDQMKRAKDMGAVFAVSPGFDPGLVECAQELDLFYMPGVATPSEVMQARALGLKTLKFFPAEAAGGTAMLKSFISPFGDVSFCPTGGISAENVADYRALKNVFCVGGSWVATNEDMMAGNWQFITDKAKQVNA